jgi:hypothetical protein
LQHDTNESQKYDSATCEEYLIQDLQNHRVFVDIEDFMTHVLHVPDDWEIRWGPTIERIKLNGPFYAAHLEFTTKCDDQESLEEDLYSPLVGMSNAILDVCESLGEYSVKPAFGLRYLRNDTSTIFQGKINNLSPDIVAVHKDLLPHLEPEERKEMRLSKTSLTWAHTLQTFEIKPFDAVIVDGSHMPRLKVNGMSATATVCGKAVLLMGDRRTRPANKPCSTSQTIEASKEEALCNDWPTDSQESCFGPRGPFEKKAASRRRAAANREGKKAVLQVVP